MRGSRCRNVLKARVQIGHHLVNHGRYPYLLDRKRATDQKNVDLLPLSLRLKIPRPARGIRVRVSVPAPAGSLLCGTFRVGMSRDTSPAANAVLTDRTRRLTPAQRVEEGSRLSRLAREFMRAGIRSRHHDYTSEQIEEALARLLWGDALYERARPGRPLLEP